MTTEPPRRPSKEQLKSSLTDLARSAKCPDCRTPVLEARCDAMDVLVDPIAIEPAVELLAVLCERITFAARKQSGRWRLWVRDEFSIAGGRDRGQHIVAQHACNAALAGTPLPKPSRAKPKTSDTPPF